jgi:hypothetical protein
LRFSASWLEIMGSNGYVQRFRILWIRTGFGLHRPILVRATLSLRSYSAIRLAWHLCLPSLPEGGLCVATARPKRP